MNKCFKQVIEFILGGILLVCSLFISGCDEPTTPREPSTWEKYWTVYYGSFNWITQVVFVSNDEAWMIKETKLVHYINGEFIDVELPPSQYLSDTFFDRMSFSDSNHGWVICWSGAIYKYENGEWQEIPPIDTTADDFHYNDVNAIATNDVWVSGYYFINASWSWHDCLWHYDGNSWARTEMLVPGIEHLKFRNTNDGYVTYMDIGDTGGVYHWNGQGWSLVQEGNTPCGVGFDNVGNTFVASLHSDIWSHYGLCKITPSNPSGEKVESSYRMEFEEIQNNSSGDIWAVGYSRLDPQSNIIAHWNGQVWHYERIYPRDLYFSSLFITERGDVWATFRVGESADQRSYLAKLNVAIP